MQIVITFENLEEMRRFAGELARDVKGKADSKKTAGVVNVKTETGKETKEQPETEESKAVEDVEDAAADAALEEKVYTLEQVRAELGALNKAGKKAEVQAIIQSFGVDKLSKIPVGKYAEVMAKAGEV